MPGPQANTELPTPRSIFLGTWTERPPSSCGRPATSEATPAPGNGSRSGRALCVPRAIVLSPLGLTSPGLLSCAVPAWAGPRSPPNPRRRGLREHEARNPFASVQLKPTVTNDRSAPLLS